ncbi:type II toxin-antitoxin system HicB family antitoxin [Coleofasciculus sp. H7-2]|uniref:type II toxin-antitoxin system HicB family antitoxin n=1 Tax=Coleofasciculus sp. H7-2 TaxID=3351545 RepID=UPI00366B65F7
MSVNFLTSSEGNLTKLTYPVLIEAQKQGSYMASVLGLPDCTTFGATREAALTNLRQLLTARLEKAEIVSLEIELPKPEHPWMKFAGMFKDDPKFDEMLEDIKALRRERDEEMEAYYQQLDAENEDK